MPLLLNLSTQSSSQLVLNNLEQYQSYASAPKYIQNFVNYLNSPSSPDNSFLFTSQLPTGLTTPPQPQEPPINFSSEEKFTGTVTETPLP